MTALVSLEGVTVVHARDQRGESLILRDVDLTVRAGERIGVLGTTERSGKSALLRVLAGALAPDAGRVIFDGMSLYEVSDTRRAALLREHIGFADPATLELTRCDRIVELVAMALMSGRVSMRSAEIRARQALVHARAGACAEMHPSELTRGERVRVAIARAIVRDPKILLVDEPAALPDPGDVDAIMRLLHATARERGIALVVASRDAFVLRGRWDTIVHVSGGDVATSDRAGELVPFPGRRSA